MTPLLHRSETAVLTYDFQPGVFHEVINAPFSTFGFDEPASYGKVGFADKEMVLKWYVTGAQLVYWAFL